MPRLRRLLATSALTGACCVLASGGAAAFDQLIWNWTLQLQSDLDQQVTTETALTPSGLAAVQGLQVHIGPVAAGSDVGGDGGDGQAPSALFLPAGGVLNLTDSLLPLDALTDLPEVISAATAIANNVSVEVEVKTDLDQTQILFDADGEVSGSYIVETLSQETVTESAESEAASATAAVSATETQSGADSFTVGGTLAADETHDAVAVVSLEELLSQQGAESVDGSLSAGAAVEAEVSATAGGGASAATELGQEVEVGWEDTRSVDFGAGIEESRNVAWFADATGNVQGSTSLNATASAEAASSLELTKQAEATASQTAALEVEASGSFSEAGAWTFTETVKQAASTSVSTTITSSSRTTRETKSVESDGELYALNTAVAHLDDLLDRGANSGFATVLSLMVATAYGGLDPAEVTASSSVDGIANASVDSNALALGNNLNATLDAATPDDAVLLGDLKQFAYARVSATSTVSDVVVANYVNLGQLDQALVDSTATALGNNLSLTIASPLVVIAGN